MILEGEERCGVVEIAALGTPHAGETEGCVPGVGVELEGTNLGSEVIEEGIAALAPGVEIEGGLERGEEAGAVGCGVEVDAVGAVEPFELGLERLVVASGVAPGEVVGALEIEGQEVKGEGDPLGDEEV